MSEFPPRAAEVPANKVNRPFKAPAGFPIVRGILNFTRARRRAGQAVLWREPSEAERQTFGKDKRFARYADFLEAVATWHDEQWLLFERAWHGWPDPARWAFFSLQADGRLFVGRDFDRLPDRWTLPAGLRAS